MWRFIETDLDRADGTTPVHGTEIKGMCGDFRSYLRRLDLQLVRAVRAGRGITACLCGGLGQLRWNKGSTPVEPGFGTPASLPERPAFGPAMPALPPRPLAPLPFRCRSSQRRCTHRLFGHRIGHLIAKDEHHVMVLTLDVRSRTVRSLPLHRECSLP